MGNINFQTDMKFFATTLLFAGVLSVNVTRKTHTSLYGEPRQYTPKINRPLPEHVEEDDCAGAGRICFYRDADGTIKTRYNDEEPGQRDSYPTYFQPTPDLIIGDLIW